MKFNMDVSEICEYLVEQIKANADVIENSNFSFTDRAGSIGEIALASSLLSRIFETFDEDAPTTEESPQVYTEEPVKELDPIAAAGTLKNYCETIVGEEELHCYDCKFHDAKFDTCELNGSLPCDWKLPQEGEDE